MKIFSLLSTGNKKLRYALFVPIFLCSVWQVNGQQSPFIYFETFDQSGVGVRGACRSTTPDSCKVFTLPQNEQWRLTGDFSGLTDSSFILTFGGEFVEAELVAGNLNTPVCFESRAIDISQFRSVGFSLTLRQLFSRDRSPDEIENNTIIEDILEEDDYVDVFFVLDGDTTLVRDSGAVHTIVNDFGARTISFNGISGRSLQILVCFLNNATNELVALDNLAVQREVANPDLNPECPLRAVLILDESGSIGGSANNVRNGAQAFVDALTVSSFIGSEPELAVIEFATDATIVLGGGYNTVDPGGTFAANFNTYAFGGGYTPAGATSWFDALDEANTLSPAPDLVIFFTDGDPNVDGGLATATAEANTLKAAGAHIYVVGVGAAGAFIGNIQSVSGTDEDFPPAGNPPPFEQADYTLTTFAGLQQIFSDIPKEVCNTELQITKKISDNQFCPPDTAIFTITVTDVVDGIPAAAVKVTDVINNGYTYLSDDGGLATTFALGTLTWDIGTIADGGTVTLQITVAVNADPANHSNTATATAANALDVSASIFDNDISIACTELEVIKSINSMEFCAPDTAIFTIVINDLPDPANLDAENVVLTDVIQNGYTYISNDQGASFAASTLTWNVGTIPNGGAVQIQITVVVNDESADHSNTATATADNAAAPASATIADADIIVGCTELEVIKKINREEFCPPAEAIFTITVKDLADPNNLDAKEVVLRDVILDGYTYVSNDQGASFDPLTNTLTWNIGTIPDQTSVQIKITVSVNPEPADHANWAIASADNALEEAMDGFSGGTIAVRCCPTSGAGRIGYNQKLCGPGNDPAPLVSLEDATIAEPGETLEYMWMQSTDKVHWMPIPGSNQPSYDPGPLKETTYFVRCARSKDECLPVESNTIKIEVGIIGKIIEPSAGMICGEEVITFTTTQIAGIKNHEYVWDFGAGESPQYLKGHTVQHDFDGYGVKTVQLRVVSEKCTSSDQVTLFVTNAPGVCSGHLRATGEVGQAIEKLSVYPNPTTGELMVTLPSAATTAGELQVLGLDGKLLLSQKFGEGASTETIDLSNYPSGIYFIKFQNAGGTIFFEKVIRQ